MQPSMNTAFEAEPPSSQMQPDAGERKLLAVSLLYTEVWGQQREKPGLLSVREAAHRLRISVTAMYALCRTGQLPYTRVLNAMRITEADLEEFLDAHHTR